MLNKVRFSLILILTLCSSVWINQPSRRLPTPKQPFPNLPATTSQPTEAIQTPIDNPQSNLPAHFEHVHSADSIPALPAIISSKTSTDSHPNYPYSALASTNNSLYPMEPFINRLGAPAGIAAASTTSNFNPVIAVIDTGFGLSHDNLKSNWAGNTNETGATLVGSSQNCANQGLNLDKRCNNYDNDNDGYPSNWRGWDFVNNDNDPSTGTSNPSGSGVAHGTLTASLAAVLNPSVKIMPLQALDDSGVGYTDTVAAAVRYAADHGASVISMSLGSAYDDAYLRSQIDYAISKGVVVVAAAGNNGCNCLSYPAAYPEVLSVGASDGFDNVATFSSYGATLNVVAPGTAGDVCGAYWAYTNQTSSYSCGYSGTSFAAPIVASLASLVQMQSPGATPGDVTRLITQNTDKPAAMGGAARTLQYGYGRINIYKSVLAASLSTPQGQLLSKTVASLSASDLANGPLLDSTCQGQPGASCDIRITSSSGSIIKYLGSQTLDEWGGANFIWNAAALGLTIGKWNIESIVTYLGQATVKPAVVLTITP